MRKQIICQSTTVLILFLTALSAQAQSSSDRPLNEIEIRGTYSIPTGEANFEGTGASGSTISFARDINFRNDFGFELRYLHRSSNGKHKFLASYEDTNWNASTTLTRTIAFNGRIYLFNLNLDSALKLRTFRGMYAYRWGNEKFRIGPMVDMGIVNPRLNLTGTTSSGVATTEASISKFAATIGYDLDYDPSPKLNIFNNLGAIAFSGEHLFHTEGGAKIFVAHHFGVLGGYKVERYKVVEGVNFIRVNAHGPFFGGVFRF